jgi:hypothetical protein
MPARTLIAVAALIVALAGPSSVRAEEVAKVQDRLNAEAIMLDPSLSLASLTSAARRLPRREITFETRIEPSRSIITRFPETFAEQR